MLEHFLAKNRLFTSLFNRPSHNRHWDSRLGSDLLKQNFYSLELTSCTGGLMVLVLKELIKRRVRLREAEPVDILSASSSSLCFQVLQSLRIADKQQSAVWDWMEPTPPTSFLQTVGRSQLTGWVIHQSAPSQPDTKMLQSSQSYTDCVRGSYTDQKCRADKDMLNVKEKELEQIPFSTLLDSPVVHHKKCILHRNAFFQLQNCIISSTILFLKCYLISYSLQQFHLKLQKNMYGDAYNNI